MNHEQIHRKPRILVAPLDWGLGHATRMVPVIAGLLQQGAEVVLGGSGASGKLLEAEFPGLAYFEIPSHTVRYSRSARGFAWKMSWQYPSLLRQVKEEQRWLRRFMETEQVDAIISDNRFGLYHPQLPSVFITHQLGIQTGGPAWLRRWVQQKNYKMISRFGACWVPDTAGAENLAGGLSHPVQLPGIPVSYTGFLSRVQKNQRPVQPGHLLIILSGPEPQRSILENKLIHEISHYNGTATVVRGLPTSRNLVPSTSQLLFYNHLPAAALADEIMKAEYVIARSGYSTLMDLALLQKKSILVPTPGQPEQEYLANLLSEKQYAVCMKQDSFSLSEALRLASRFSYRPWPVQDENRLSGLLQEFLHTLSAG